MLAEFVGQLDKASGSSDFHSRTQCNHYSVEKSQMDKEQKHSNDYFYPRTEINQYSVENITGEEKTNTNDYFNKVPHNSLGVAWDND